jgi:hypothetical protein
MDESIATPLYCRQPAYQLTLPPGVIPELPLGVIGV